MNGIFLSACIAQRQSSAIRPLGPYQIAWYLREHGYKIQVIDFIWALQNHEIEELIEKFITPETKFIGFGLMVDLKHSHIKAIKVKMGRLVTSLRAKYPTLKMIMGGSVTAMYSTYYQNGVVFDYFVEGYGENQTLAIFDHVFKGTKHPPFTLVNGNKHLTESVVTSDFKTFDFQQSRHKWHKNDCIQPGESLPIEVSRGCIFKCAFCRYPHIGKKKNDFTRNLDCLREELIYNYENFNVTTYFITDDTFNADHQFIIDFTEMVKTLPFKLQYAAYLRADLLHAHPEQEDMFLENGLIATFFGIESLNLEDSKLVGKPWSGKYAKEYVPYIYNEKWGKKILVTIGMIAGLPNENLEDLKEVNKWAIENNIPVIAWHPLSIIRDSTYHKSEFDKNAEQYGINFRLKDGIMTWYSHNCDSDLAFEWVQELQNSIKHYMPMSTWALIESGSFGYNLEELSKIKIFDIDWEDYKIRCDNFVENYFRDLKSL